MLEWRLLAERESLSSQNSFFEIMGKEGQISFPVLGCARENKASQIIVACRFIPLEHPVCLTLTHLTLVLRARRVGTKMLR